MRIASLLPALILVVAVQASTAIAGSCLTPNGSLSLGVPGLLEASAGLTIGTATANQTKSCTGVMLDAGANLAASRLAFGMRTFQRYDWPAAAQVNAFTYLRHSDRNGGIPGQRCHGIEAGYGAFMTMLRLGVARCPDTGSNLLLLHFGGFY